MIADRELSEFLCDGLPTSTPLRLPEQWLRVHEEGSSTQGNTTALLNISVCVCVCVCSWKKRSFFFFFPDVKYLTVETSDNYCNKVIADIVN